MTKRPVVLITDIAWPTTAIEAGVLAPLRADLRLAERGDEAELVASAHAADAIMTCWQKVTAPVLAAAPNCRVVARYGIGLDNIAVDRATELGILVTNVPDFCLDEVSDHAMALLLACARQIIPFANATRDGVWQPAVGQTLPRLRGKTLAVIGYGAIARALIPKALAFGLNVIVYTPRLSAGIVQPGVLGTNNLKHALREADFISIHAPSTAETRGMFNAEVIGWMKPTAWLINTSRGALVDEAALLDALQQGRLAGAALDVLSEEPPESSNPLIGLPNVIVTPHVAFASEGSVEELQRKAAERVAEVLRGEIPQHLVNPQVLDQANCRL